MGMVSEIKLMNKNFLIYNRIKIYRMKFNAYIKKLLTFLENNLDAIIEEKVKRYFKFIEQLFPNGFLILICIANNEFFILLSKYFYISAKALLIINSN